MAERTQVTEVMQIGSETTLGTAVPALKSLPSIKLASGLDGSFSEIVPSGLKFPTQQVIGKEWAKGSLSGQPTYDELTYLLAGVLNKPTPAIQGATTAYLWTFSPSSSVEDTVASYTVERGSAVRAHKSAGNVITSLKLSGDRDKLDVSADMMGQLFTDGVTLTPAAVAVPLVPLFPKEVDVYVDTTSAGLGGTKLGRLFKWEITLGNRFGPLWVVDSAQTSWVVPVEQVIDGKFSMTVEADAAGMAFLSAMRDGSTRYIRVKATSPTLAGVAFPYSLTFDMACQMAGVPKDFSDEQGTVAVGWEFKMVHNPTWGKALTVGLMNKQSAL